MVSELPSIIAASLQMHEGNPTVIVATIDSNGAPHTAPFGSLRAINTRRLRFGCDRKHDTYSNLRRDDHISVSLVIPPNIAVSISGRASVVKEQMSLLKTDAIIEITIANVKDDTLAVPGVTIDSGITYSLPAEAKEMITRYIAEIDSG